MQRRLGASVAVAAGLIAAIATGAILRESLASHSSPYATKPARGTAASVEMVTLNTPPVLTPPSGTTLIANITSPTPDYSTPSSTGQAARIGTIPKLWHDSRVALPVIAQRPGWLEVRLPQRPNGQTAWIDSTVPRLSYTGYAIRIDVTTMRLRLYLRGDLIMDAPAGVGALKSPTPIGHFFIAYLAQPPTTGYGPFVIVTSAHSNVITDWEASGDAEIGIHGPLGMNAAIGKTGARVSHGCVRLHLANLAELRNLPLGTPVTITS